MRPPIYPAYDSSQNVAPLQPSQQPAYPAPQMPFSPSSPPPASQPSTAPGIDIFVPMTTSTIPIPSCDEHPVPRRCIRAPGNATPPSQTNAFYGNWLLGEQGCSIWTHPYSLSWPKGNGNAKSWGIAVSHVDREQLAFGEPTSTGGSRYYINPNGEFICFVANVVILATEIMTPVLSRYHTDDFLLRHSLHHTLRERSRTWKHIGVGLTPSIQRECESILEL